jgi:hypothetical protein
MKRKETVEEHNRQYLKEAHDTWVWSITNPLEKGIQKSWKYKCAYCGSEVAGALLLENPNCPECGALLNE